jgi:hypothetical protein
VYFCIIRDRKLESEGLAFDKVDLKNEIRLKYGQRLLIVLGKLQFAVAV